MSCLMEQLAEMRRAQGLTQAQVARILGTTQPHVSRMEKTENPHLSTVEQYAHAIGARIEVRLDQ